MSSQTDTESQPIPFFTVVTPSYNSARFIAETMRTVAMQRENGRVRVEHIIMDGGSTDGTAEIVARYAHPDTHFYVAKDRGPADAINHGMQLAHGEYLCWLNSDDEYAPFALERAAAALKKYPKAAFIFGRCQIINQEGREIRHYVTVFKDCFFPISCHFLIRTLNYISQPAMFFRRSAWLAAGPLRIDYKAAWDYDLTLRLWHHGGGKPMPNPEMAYFRWTPRSISGTSFEQQFAEGLASAREDAGKWALSSMIHCVLVRLVIIFYKYLCSRRPTPVTKERIDLHENESLKAFREAADLATAAAPEEEETHS